MVSSTLPKQDRQRREDGAASPPPPQQPGQSELQLIISSSSSSVRVLRMRACKAMNDRSTHRHSPPLIKQSEVLHLTPPSSPLPREGGRDFVLMGGVALGATSRHTAGGGTRPRADREEEQHQPASSSSSSWSSAGGGRELMEQVDFIGPADSMKGAWLCGVHTCVMGPSIKHSS